MVPFGKHAFFPGRLVHTNELLVLLGDGYFAERTAKQTVDILKKRGKTLECQVDSLKAVIEDLKIEASFFGRTASEAAEGLVEIREELTDDDKDSEESKANPNPFIMSKEDSGTRTVDDEEYARITSRLDELEKEELEAEDTEEHDDGNHEDLNKSISFPKSEPAAGSLMSRPVSDSLKAFTGSIVERTDNLQISSNKGTSTQSSKPVSRFKMQRRAT